MPFIPNFSDATYGAQSEIDSVDFEMLLGGIKGDGVISGCAVTAKSPESMNLAVASGSVRIAGATVSVTGADVTIGTANATNPRFDLVSVNSSGTLAVTAGTAAAQPVYPSLPASSVILAAVFVPANDTAIGSQQIIDKRLTAPTAATTSAAGVVQLSDSTSSTSTSLAATANAVKTAYDLANGAIAKTIVDAKGDLIVATGADAVSRLAVGATNGHVLTVDSAEATGMKWAAVAASGDYTWLVKASDESVTNSTTYQDDNDLTFSVSTNSVYVIEWGQYIVADATGGYKMQWTYPTNASLVGPASVTQSGNVTGFDTASPLSAGLSSAAIDGFRWGRMMLLTGNTSGSLTFQFACNASGGTITMKKGSYLAYRKLV